MMEMKAEIKVIHPEPRKLKTAKKAPMPETKAERSSQLSEENTIGNIFMLDLNFQPCKMRVNTSVLFEPTRLSLSVLAKERQKCKQECLQCLHSLDKAIYPTAPEENWGEEHQVLIKFGGM